MSVDLYIARISAPCRAVWMCAKALNIPFNIKDIDLMKGEQKSPDFIKMNPHHTVPTIDDGGFYLWESRAILGYLVDKYAKDDALYPKDVQKRAVVNRYLYYDLGIVYRAIGEYMYPQLFQKAAPAADKTEKVNAMLDVLDETHLKGKIFLTGDSATIADFAVIASLVFLQVFDFDFSKWANVSAYLKRAEELPYFQECNGPVYAFRDTLKAKK